MNDGRKRKAQKHQNSTAYKIQYKPMALEIQKKVSFKGLCQRCADQINWKLQYNKYKKMSQPAKCTYCLQKNVFRSYMRACEDCAQEKAICPKCLEAESQVQKEVKLNALEQKKVEEESEKKMNVFMKTLKERSRRTVTRQMQKGAIHWDSEQSTFLDEHGKPIVLHFRNGFMENDESNFEDMESEEEDCEKEEDIPLSADN